MNNSKRNNTVVDALKFGGQRERNMAIELIKAAHANSFEDALSEQLYCDCLNSDWIEDNIPFVCMNTNSGNVWISGGSEGYDCLMLNSNDKVELHVFTSYSGIEGFLSELIMDLNHPTEAERVFDWSNDEDVEYIRELETGLADADN